MKNKKTIEDLANIIETVGKKCTIYIDNDCWSIQEQTPDNLTDKELEDFDPKEYANSHDFKSESNWYTSSNIYGVGIAEALVIILNRNGYNIELGTV